MDVIIFLLALLTLCLSIIAWLLSEIWSAQKSHTIMIRSCYMLLLSYNETDHIRKLLGNAQFLARRKYDSEYIKDDVGGDAYDILDQAITDILSEGELQEGRNEA